MSTREEGVRLAKLRYEGGLTSETVYQGGTINYIDVLDAQRRYLEAQIARTNAIRDEHLALVQLYKALGGGWTLKE